MQALRRIAIPVALIIGSVLFFIFALELTLRAINYPRGEARVLCLDAIMGNVYCANFEGHLAGLYEQKEFVKVNSDGMADREYPIAKPDGTIRIALLGDSVTANISTPSNEKFKTHWENSLSKSMRKPVEFMNFAVDGTSTWEQLQMYHLRAKKYKPDYVVLSFFWGNDVWNNSASLSRGRPNPLKDEYGPPTWLRSVAVKHRKTIRWLWNNSAAYQFLDTLKDKLQTNLAYTQALKEVPAAVKTESTVINEPHYDPSFTWDSESWELTRKLIIKLKSDIELDGIQLLVFQIPAFGQLILPKPLPYQQFNEFLDQNQIAHIDAFDALVKLTQEEKLSLYYADQIHLNANGNRFFADATTPALKTFLEKPRKPTKN